MQPNWFMGIYFRPKNGLLPELIDQDGKRKPLTYIGNIENLTDLIKESSITKSNNPIAVFNGTHTIDHIDKLIISNKHLEILQSKTLSFYFYEPLTHYKPDIHGNAQPHILKIDNNEYELSNLRAYELDSLQEFAVKYDLKINVYCTDYKCWDYYKSVYPNLKLLAMDLFVEWWSNHCRIEERKNFVTNREPMPPEFFPELIQKKFWSGAWRYDPSRHLITAFLEGKNLVEDNNVSFYFGMSNYDMKRRMWFGWKELELKHPAFAKIIEEGNDRLRSKVPLSFAVSNPIARGPNDGIEPSMEGNKRHTHDPTDTYFESFCAIVQESRVTQPWPNISEKTLNAIKSLRPFVLCGAPGVLQMLKDMGFKTFDKYWPEDYDNIISNKDRIVRICEIIEYIDTFDIDELREMYEDMEEILVYNLYNLKKIPDFYNQLNKKLGEVIIE
tara:strand:- start:116 stop:1444 length:1329 start_codon:yes stop_codon:yes gene_type:complete